MLSFILSVLRGQILPHKLINKIAYQHKSLRKLLQLIEEEVECVLKEPEFNNQTSFFFFQDYSFFYLDLFHYSFFLPFA